MESAASELARAKCSILGAIFDFSRLRRTVVARRHRAGVIGLRCVVDTRNTLAGVAAGCVFRL